MLYNIIDFNLDAALSASISDHYPIELNLNVERVTPAAAATNDAHHTALSLVVFYVIVVLNLL